MPPVRLNLVKCSLAAVLFTGVVLVQWVRGGAWPVALPLGLLGMLALSGVVGLAVGDTLLFAGLNRIGARRMLLIFTLHPVITAAIAWPILGETLTPWQMLGMALTIAGIGWVITERNHERSDGHVDLLGLLFCVGAAACQAAGALMTRYVFDVCDATEGLQIGAPESAWVRMVPGAIAVALFLPMDRYLRDSGGKAHHHPDKPSHRRAYTMLTGGVLLGTFLGVWLQQAAFKYSGHVGIASTILATSPLFVLPLTAMLGEHISKRAVLGALVTVAGIVMLFLFAG